jgi:recombination protein RecA
MAEEKKAEKSPDGLVSLEDALAGIKKQHGEGVVVAANRATIVRVPRMVTHVFALDLAVGGGLPIGRISLISGEKNAAKTTLALRALADWQRRCHRCFGYRLVCWTDALPFWAPEICACNEPLQQVAIWSDVEGVWDPDWAEACGVVGVKVLGKDEPEDEDEEGDDDAPKKKKVARIRTPPNVYLIRPDYAEQGIDIMDSLIRSRDVGLLIVDSLAQLVPMIEVEASSEDKQQAEGAKLCNKFIRKIAAAVAYGKTLGIARTIILLNQLRESTGYTRPGMPPNVFEPHGKGQTYAASVWLRLKWGGYEWAGVDKKKGVPKGRAADWSRTTFKVRSTKVGPPGYEGEFLLAVQTLEGGLVPRAGADDVDFTMNLARKLGIWRQRQKKQRLGFADGEVVVGEKDEDVRLALQRDRGLLAAVQRRIVALTYEEV